MFVGGKGRDTRREGLLRAREGEGRDAMVYRYTKLVTRFQLGEYRGNTANSNERVSQSEREPSRAESSRAEPSRARLPLISSAT